MASTRTTVSFVKKTPEQDAKLRTLDRTQNLAREARDRTLNINIDMKSAL